MFRFSKDYEKKYLGLNTKAKEYDKLVHLAGSFTLTCLLSLVFPIFIAAVVAFAVGIILEIWQGFKDPWGFSFMDCVANLVGNVFAYGFVTATLRCTT